MKDALKAQLSHLQLSTAATEAIDRAVGEFEALAGEAVSRIIVSERSGEESEQAEPFTSVSSVWFIGGRFISEVKNPLSDTLSIDFSMFDSLSFVDISASSSEFSAKVTFGPSGFGSLSGDFVAVSPENIRVVRAFTIECIRALLVS